MLNILNFKHIYYFWVVAAEGSIIKASTILNVASSSISEQIKLLEFRLGVELFQRSGKHLVLTEIGTRVFDEINPFFSKTEELFESIINHKKTNVRFLRIGLIPGLPENDRYQLTFPFIEDITYTVRVIKGENLSLKQAFMDNELDMVFSLNDNLIPKKKAKRVVIRSIEHGFVCSSSFRKQLSTKKFPDCLDQQRFVNFTNDSDLHFLLYKFFHGNRVSPHRIAEIDDIFILKRLVLEGQCVALLPLSVMEEDIKKKEVFVLGKPKNFVKSLTCYYHRSFEEHPFIDHLNSLIQ